MYYTGIFHLRRTIKLEIFESFVSLCADGGLEIGRHAQQAAGAWAWLEGWFCASGPWVQRSRKLWSPVSVSTPPSLSPYPPATLTSPVQLTGPLAAGQWWVRFVCYYSASKGNENENCAAWKSEIIKAILTFLWKGVSLFWSPNLFCITFLHFRSMCHIFQNCFSKM